MWGVVAEGGMLSRCWIEDIYGFSCVGEGKTGFRYGREGGRGKFGEKIGGVSDVGEDGWSFRVGYYGGGS